MNWPVSWREGVVRITCAASAMMSGVRPASASAPGIIFSASVAITVRGHSAFTATPCGPNSAARPSVTRLMPILASV